ncbi:MAG: agmatinase [Candidatus Latescibacteria bacterium]|nr:agmatinase [Candidatus Latescibacterota bacterium]
MTWPLHEDPGAFGGLPERPVPDLCRFAVLPIPYDGTSTWRKGADRGPDALLAASSNMELYDIETASEPWRAGIVTMAPVLHDGPPEGMVAKVRAAADDLLDRGLTVVGLGGEHSVSIGLIQAHAARHPGLTVLQFDAHGDTRDSYEGSPNNHACVMARAAEIADYVQVGIRSLDAAEAPKLRPGRTFFAHEIGEGYDFIPAVVERLSGPVYVTIDLDVFDPGIMPSTGTPEPGGLSYRQVVRTLAAVARSHRIVGFDVVELLPDPRNPGPDFLAARLAYQLMAYLTARQ